jgi:AraC-like DNA-binding protein
MFGKLDYIRDWEGRARRAGYQSDRLALACGVSLRRLEQFFRQTRGVPPCCWLQYRRLRDGVVDLPEKVTVKEAANLLGFRDTANFCRLFKRLFGRPPGVFLWQHQSRAARISFFDNFISENDNQIWSTRTEEVVSNIAEISPSSYENATIPDFSGRHHHTLGTANQAAGRGTRSA